MGTFSKGILGRFKGLVGTVVGSKWKGRTVMRSRQEPRTKGSFSQKQLEQQAKFSLMINFLQQLKPLLNQTFDRSPKSMTGFNKALSYNIVQAIAGNFPAFTIDYARVQLSQGSLPGVVSPTCSSTVAGKLVFTWPDNSNGSELNASELASDLVYLAIYSQEINQWVYGLGAAQRDAETATLQVKGFTGRPVHTYLGFISFDGSKVSNSFYTGIVTVS